jgi:hypothetical protein
VLAKQLFPAGAAVTVSLGIGFLNAADGSLETWSPIPGALPGGAGTTVATPDGALLVYYPSGEGEPARVIERASGRTWRLGANIHPRPELAAGTRMAVSVRTGEDEQPAIVDFATGAVVEFGTKQHYLAGFQGVTSPDGRRFALQLGTDVILVDIASAELTELAEGIASDGYTHVTALPGALGFTIVPTDTGAPRRWFSWEGYEVDSTLSPGALAPSGRYIASGWSPGGIRATGMGATPAVGAVTIADRSSGRPLVQILGAELSPLEDLAWAVTGEALVVEVAEGYRFMSASGQVITTIADEFHRLNPRPSPTIAGLLGTNAGTIINVARGSTIAPNYADMIWRAAWSTRPGELIVELSTPGKGRDWLVDVLPFDVRTSGIDAPPQIEVGNDTDNCAKLFARPELSASELECMPDGLHGQVTQVDDPATPSKPSSEPPRRVAGIEDASGAVWLHVDMADGASGWARTTDLTWAD